MTAEFGALFTSLKTAAEIAKALVDLRDAALTQSKVIELQGEIISAQSCALATQGEQSALLDRVRDLERESADLEAWGTEKQKYRLTEVRSGVFAHAIKEEGDSAEPAHLLCPNCYEDGCKAILQKEQRGGPPTRGFRRRRAPGISLAGRCCLPEHVCGS